MAELNDSDLTENQKCDFSNFEDLVHRITDEFKLTVDPKLDKQFNTIERPQFEMNVVTKDQSVEIKKDKSSEGDELVKNNELIEKNDKLTGKNENNLDKRKDVNYDFIDYSEYEDLDNSSQTQKEDPNETKYIRNGKKFKFDDRTMIEYAAIRRCKIDPITHEEIDEKYCFKFRFQWDPFTGERLKEEDPYGPLYFDPDGLIRYFYINRLKCLWCEEEIDGEIRAGYGDALGAGPDIYIVSRGKNPEKYLFRLPINDCYWSEEQLNYSCVTMGPKLTDEEIKEIDELAKKRLHNYYTLYNKNRPSLTLMKEYYEMAIAKEPKTEMTYMMTETQKKYFREKMNIAAVKKLREMSG